MRMMGKIHGPAEGSIEKEVTALAELQRQGLVRHIGLSNVTSAQVAEAQGIAKIVCVQNLFNLADQRSRDVLTECEARDIAFVPYFPLGSAFSGGPKQLAQDPAIAGVAIIEPRKPPMTPL